MLEKFVIVLKSEIFIAAKRKRSDFLFDDSQLMEKEIFYTFSTNSQISVIYYLLFPVPAATPLDASSGTLNVFFNFIFMLRSSLLNIIKISCLCFVQVNFNFF